MIGGQESSLKAFVTAQQKEDELQLSLQAPGPAPFPFKHSLRRSPNMSR